MIDKIKCNECGKYFSLREMLDDKRMCKDCYIKWLETDFVKMRTEQLEEKLEQAEKDLADYQFNYPTIKELEKENAELRARVNEQSERISELTQELDDKINRFG